MNFLRFLFRFFGGFHRSEHELILRLEINKIEKEVAELQTYKLAMELRYKLLNGMLAEELERRL